MVVNERRLVCIRVGDYAACYERLAHLLGTDIWHASGNEAMEHTRFNFLLPRVIRNEFASLCRKKRLPMGVYLRLLIERDMEKNGHEVLPYRSRPLDIQL